MKVGLNTFWLHFGLLLCMIPSYQQGFAQYARDQYDWERYGDWYPTTPRAHSDIVCFMDFEGPGNRNPGNWLGLNQSNPALRIPAGLRAYMAREFTYVWFDMDSFSDRDSLTHIVRHLMTDVYHAEAKSLRDQSHGHVITLPYFNFAMSVPQFPWYPALQESWFMHEASRRSQRISTSDGVTTWYLMDVSQPSYRSFYCHWIDSIVTRWGYDSAVAIDDMTPYPFVDSTGYANMTSSAYNRWLNNLQLFLADLRNSLARSGHAGTKVIYNGIGLDSYPLHDNWYSYDHVLWKGLFGTNHGLDLIASADGGIMEGFHSTAWRNASGGLDIVLGMMRELRDKGKVFLAGTHYARDADATLSQNFGLPPQKPWTTGNYPLYPSLSTFHRMQMSYLARFLLVTPAAGSPAVFATSFQPGTSTSQFIPYYRPWDERIGTPLPGYAASYKDSAGMYIREFTHCIVVVNTSVDSSVQFTPPPAQRWYRFTYMDADTAHNSDPVPVFGPILLNKMEGTILFREIR